MLALGAACGVFNIIVSLKTHPGCGMKWLWVLQCVWAAVLLGGAANFTAGAWQGSRVTPAVPLTLLALAAFSAQSGGERASRAGAVLAWFVVLLFAVALAAGVPQWKIKYLAPRWQMPRWALIPVFLLPSAVQILPCEKRPGPFCMLGAALPPLLLTLCVNGVLLPTAEKYASPFLEYSKSISLFGAAERFESVISCAMTMGWFAFLSLVLAGAGEGWERLRPGWGKYGVWGSAAVAAAMTLAGVAVPEALLAAGTVLTWVILPLVMPKNKLKKDEKRC